MAQPRRHHPHLRVVETPPSDPTPILADQAARREFERLTQALVDAAIEIMDLVDGDPDLEASGDEEDDASV